MSIHSFLAQKVVLSYSVNDSKDTRECGESTYRCGGAGEVGGDVGSAVVEEHSRVDGHLRRFIFGLLCTQ